MTLWLLWHLEINCLVHPFHNYGIDLTKVNRIVSKICARIAIFTLGIAVSTAPDHPAFAELVGQNVAKPFVLTPRADTSYIIGPPSDLSSLKAFSQNASLSSASNLSSPYIGQSPINDYREDRYRPTSLLVTRSITFTHRNQLHELNLTIPVVYQSGSMILDPLKITALLALKRRIETHIQECLILENRTRQLHEEWETFVESTSPKSVLSK
jgi:hypothetical protein